jgi:hypothetical protein
MSTKRFAILVLALMLSASSGCGKAKNSSDSGSPGPARPKVTPELVSGSWEGGADGDVKREAFFGKDGKGLLRVFIEGATIRYDFAYDIDTASGSLRLVNALDDKKDSKPGKAELTPDGKMHFVLASQDCVLTRSVTKK